MSDVAGKKISRRTVAKGAAWSVPVVAVAAAAPAHAASPTGNVVVSGSCKGLDLGVVTIGHPVFTITATGVSLPAGATLTLDTGSVAAADLQLLGETDNGITLKVLDGGGTQVVLNNGLADGSSTTLEVGGTGSNGGIELNANVLSTFRLTLDGGQVEQTSTSDDTASVGLTGVSVLGVDLAACA